MMKYVYLAAVLVAGVLSQEITDDCLNCICEGTTGCNLNFTCETNVCGPYKITEFYWVDAGKPVVEGDKPTDSDAFRNCALDYDCATLAVKNYVHRYQMDCNLDDVIDCVDYALLHRFGGLGCYAQTLPEDEWTQRFEECQQQA